jgi:hypothetical protein
MQARYSKVSLILTALAVPLALFVGKLLEFILKSTNPSNVNVASSLAYLGIIIMSSIIVAVVCWVASMLCVVVAKKKGEDISFTKAALIVLVVTICLTVIGLLASKTTDNIIDNAKQASVSSHK